MLISKATYNNSSTYTVIHTKQQAAHQEPLRLCVLLIETSTLKVPFAHPLQCIEARPPKSVFAFKYVHSSEAISMFFPFPLAYFRIYNLIYQVILNEVVRHYFGSQYLSLAMFVRPIQFHSLHFCSPERQEPHCYLLNRLVLYSGGHFFQDTNW